MSALAAPCFRTTSELAHSLRLSEQFVEELLEESVDAGYVERTPDGWRLSAWAERRFGAALRGLEGWTS